MNKEEEYLCPSKGRRLKNTVKNIKNYLKLL